MFQLLLSMNCNVGENRHSRKKAAEVKNGGLVQLSGFGFPFVVTLQQGYSCALNFCICRSVELMMMVEWSKCHSCRLYKSSRCFSAASSTGQQLTDKILCFYNFTKLHFLAFNIQTNLLLIIFLKLLLFCQLLNFH